MEESKKIEVFEFEVISATDIILSDGLKLEIKNAWIENSWSREHHIVGHDQITRNSDDHQLIMNINIIDTSFQSKEKYYYFIGNKPLDTFMHYHLNKIDIIKVPLYRETKPKILSKKERRAFDSLTFIRR